MIGFNLKISKKIPNDRILKKQIDLIKLETCKNLKCFVEMKPFIQAKDLEPLFEQNFGYAISYPNILYVLKKLGWSHKVKAIASKYQVRLVYLPTYNPDLNPNLLLLFKFQPI